MKKYIILTVLFFLFGCENSKQDNSQADAASKTNKIDQSVDQFEEKVQLQYARHFSVSYHGNYKIVRTDATFYPDDTTNGELEQDVLILVQKGTELPSLGDDLKNAPVINIPIETAAVNVQHSESFLRELDLEHHINTIGGLYSYNDEMRDKAVRGDVGQVGYSWHSPPNLEVLLNRKPDLFFMTLASMSHRESLQKCRQLDIPAIAVFDWAEQDYLARAEWIKFYSLFFNREGRANEVFQEIATEIEGLKDLASKTEKEKALWGYHTSKGRWLVEVTSFPAQYLRDANLENVIEENTKPNANGVQSISTEELLTRASGASHWVLGDIHAAPLPQENLLSSIGAWNSGRLYHNMKRVNPKTNTADWYAKAVVRPDIVLADVIKLTRPELLPEHEPFFMGIYPKQ